MGRIKSSETKAERMARRDTDVKKRYEELREKRVHKVRMYTHEAILNMIGYEFYLSPIHVNNIINGYNNNAGNKPEEQQTEADSN